MAQKSLEWSDKFSTDIVSIDNQHQELIFLTQNLLEVLSSDTADLKEKQDAFQDLVDHALDHFEYEERLMKNIGYPWLKEHIKEHDELRKEVGDIAQNVMQGEGMDDWKGLVSLVQVWVLRHIVSSDTKIRTYLRREDELDF